MGFSQVLVQGCCDSGQLLPEYPSPPHPPHPESRVIGRPAKDWHLFAWFLSLPLGLVVWWVPMLLGAGLASPPPSCCVFLMNSTTLCLGHWGCRDASNQVLSVHPALPFVPGSSSIGLSRHLHFLLPGQPWVGQLGLGERLSTV